MLAKNCRCCSVVWRRCDKAVCKSCRYLLLPHTCRRVVCGVGWQMHNACQGYRYLLLPRPCRVVMLRGVIINAFRKKTVPAAAAHLRLAAGVVLRGCDEQGRSRNSCRRSGVSCGGILFSLHAPRPFRRSPYRVVPRPKGCIVRDHRTDAESSG